jgi:hypothetical protein
MLLVSYLILSLDEIGMELEDACSTGRTERLRLAEPTTGNEASLPAPLGEAGCAALGR